ncbi:VOC family protein [Ancylobacter dichloromethanicus]
MERGLDHVVHVVRDLEAAGELYDMLGFTVGSRNRHPWGTDNRIVQTPGFFVELLEIADPGKIPPQEETHFSFGAFNRDFLADVGPGLSMLVLEGRDAAIDKLEFDKAGIGGLDLFEFEREGKRLDGVDVKVAFTLAFARDPASPHAGFFTCLQHFSGEFLVAGPAAPHEWHGGRGRRGVHRCRSGRACRLPERVRRHGFPACRRWLAHSEKPRAATST